MNRTARWSLLCLVFLLCVAGAQAQRPPVSAEPQAPGRTAQVAPESVPTLPVPRLVKFAGVFKDEQGKAPGMVGVTFAIYKEQEGGAPLWLETQNVELDEQGHYSVLLGATKNEGLPLELFSSGEPRWLGVQVNLPKEVEQPRVLLVSVPYALKAADAETLGGKPFSAFVLATPPSEGGAGASKAPNAAATTAGAAATIGGGGTQNVVAKFDATGVNVINSSISDNGGRINAGEGIDFSSDFSFVGNANPTATGRVQMFDRAFVGFVVRGLNVLFETLQGTPAVPTEVMRVTQAGNVGIGTTTPSQKLEVGGNLKISGGGNALVFPDGSVMGSAATGVGGGTITGVTAGTGLTGGGTAGGVTLGIASGGVTNALLAANSVSNANIADGSLAPAKITGTAATLSANSFTGNQSITGNVSLTGNLALPNTTSATAGVITLGGARFLQNFGTNNTFVGAFAGNTSPSLTGGFNTGVGANALFSNATGLQNAAFGFDALTSNTMGNNNAAFGSNALQANTTGFQNAAFGSNALAANNPDPTFPGTAINNSAFGNAALQANTTGLDNSAFGAAALVANTTGLDNSAFGAVALVANTTGGLNAAFGEGALNFNDTGNNNSAFGAGALLNLRGASSSNIGIGANAGSTLQTGSNNIYIGNSGVSIESNTIHLGSGQTATFIAGIFNQTSANGVAVLVNSNSQLGTTTSSRRFKHEIADLGAESDLLLKLRPVAFYYKPELDDTQTRQYGLVAEEVAQVAPQLVVFDKDGAPQTVRYHFVNAMLLNEVQKQRAIIVRQESKIQDLAARLAKLEALLAAGPQGPATKQ